jgi:hypothetical protein
MSRKNKKSKDAKAEEQSPEGGSGADTHVPTCTLPGSLGGYLGVGDDGSKCGLGMQFCFLPGTCIEMADQTQRPIADIGVGDRVLSWDVPLGAFAEGCVTKILTGTVYQLIRLNSKLTASPTHRILTAGGYRSFDEIELGDLLIQVSGSGIETETVVSIERLPGAHRVYNLVVTPHASFIAEGFLVEDYEGVPESRPNLVGSYYPESAEALAL